MIPKHLLHPEVLVTLSEYLPAARAAEAMSRHAVGCVLVVSETGALRGILTDRDLALAVASDAELRSLPLSSLMTPNPVTVRTDEDIEAVIHRMEENGVRRIPVVEGASSGQLRCLGLITLDDLVLERRIDYDHLVRVLRGQVRPRPQLAVAS
jgi:CBS domain-containing protein